MRFFRRVPPVATSLGGRTSHHHFTPEHYINIAIYDAWFFRRCCLIGPIITAITIIVTIGIIIVIGTTIVVSATTIILNINIITIII